MPALLTLLTGLIVTSVLFVSSRHLENDKIEASFRQNAAICLQTVQNELDNAIMALGAINQLFVTNPSVSREQFHVFTRPLLERYPYVLNFNFHRIVSLDERAAFEAKRRKRYPNFAIMEVNGLERVTARSRPQYRVVDYIEPMQGNEAAFGLDADFQNGQAAALRRAADSGQPAATGLFRLAQEKGEQRGFLVLMPVYRQNASLHDAASRRQALIGDTSAAFRAGDLIGQILVKTQLMNPADISISVYADAAPDDKHLVYRTGGKGMPASDDGGILPHWLLHNRPTTVAMRFEVAGTPWHMTVSAAPEPFYKNNNNALYALIVSALLSVLAAAYVYTLSSRSRRIQSLVNLRTAELQFSNQRLNDDIAAREKTEHRLQILESAVQSSANSIFITSASAPEYAIEYVNPAFERMTGYTAAEVIGRDLRFLFGDDREQEDIKNIQEAVRNRRQGHAVIRNYRKDGTLFWAEIYFAPVRDETGQVHHFVVSSYDITANKRYQAELEFQAGHDILTGLANRNLLGDRLRQAITDAACHGHPVWAVSADLDRFKFVNDTLGHKAGDMLLQAVGKRLEHAVRASDTVARLSADQFVLVLQERGDSPLTLASIEQIMDTIAQPLAIHGHSFQQKCSIGVAIYPADGDDPEILMKHADIAMYRAKESGRNNIQFYEASMNVRALERLRLEGDLRNALERNEFLLHYQPQVDLRSGHIVGMEALIRWQHPTLGMIAPDRFIMLAEETGLIVPIGAWVIRTACAQNRAWQLAGLGYLRVAVNLSAIQFAQQDIVKSIAAVLQETGLAAQYLEIELTESLIMTDVEHAIGILRELKALGLQLSIDDFGTGYSSLSYLKRFPIDVLKIDQSFVRDITIDPDDAAIVAAIISLAHSLRINVIAEGVETAAQLAYLRRNQCDEMQGYYFSRPVPADAFELILRHNKSLPAEDLSQAVK
ncbi:MAG: EAL domain-containing protein [Oxalobacteraceae bacterium]|nr:EAL domain-containing protein [Oxalobacteraceae bacterium]